MIDDDLPAWRRGLEAAGLLVTGGLAALVIGFVLLYWLQDLPYIEVAYVQFRHAGYWLDTVLGTDVFYHPFMWQSFTVGILAGIAAPLVGTYVVHREMALIGETLAHTAFAGVAFGVIVIALTGWSGSLLLVAVAVGIVGALGVEWLTEHTRTYGDVPIAVMLSGSFAIGTILISWSRDVMAVAIDVEGYLFGTIAIVTVESARLMAVVTVLTVATIALTHRQLLFITFDEQAARVARLPVRRYNALLIVLTAIVVVGAIQVLGVILVAAMLVVPVAAATEIARSFGEAQVLSVLFGQAAVIVGFAVSIWAELPSGGSIVLAAIAIYLLAIAATGRGAGSVRAY